MASIRLGHFALGLSFGLGLGLPAAGADEWREEAKRSIEQLDATTDDRSICMLKKLLESDEVDDHYFESLSLAKLPQALEGSTVAQFVDEHSFRLRERLAENVNRFQKPEDLRGWFRSWVDGEMKGTHNLLTSPEEDEKESFLAVWNYLVAQAKNAGTLYSCYADLFTDQS